jgi:NDP-sugar pyrophosphorylase family protein
LMDSFSDQGFKKFWLCLGYKASLILDYFGDGSSRGWDIEYVVENEPMGTGGALNLIPGLGEPFILCNADVRTNVSYTGLLDAHIASGADATVCAALYQPQIPYGVLDTDNGRLTGIREKPIESFAVNAGIYVVGEGINFPEGCFDMTDLIGGLDDVLVYPIEGYWEDVGKIEDRERLRA